MKPESNHKYIKWITITAMFMALNVVMSSFSVPVPGGHLYLNDVVICTASILLDPIAAFAVGGLGAFLGDFFFYQKAMFISLIVHGVQAVVISLCARKLLKNRPIIASIIGVSIGAVIMVVGYTFGRVMVYATMEYSLLKLPFQILQAVVGAVAGVVLCYGLGVKKLFDKFMSK